MKGFGFVSGHFQRNRKSSQIEKRKSRAFTPALIPAKSQGAGGSLKSLYISVYGKKHFSSPPQPRDKRGTAGVDRAAICVSRFAQICGFRSQNALGRVSSYRKIKGWIVTSNLSILNNKFSAILTTVCFKTDTVTCFQRCYLNETLSFFRVGK